MGAKSVWAQFARRGWMTATVAILAVLALSPTVTASAAEIKAKCFVQTSSGKLRGPTLLNIGVCASLAGQQSAKMPDGVGRGTWDQLEIQAKADGTYQALKNGTTTITRYWDVEQLVNDRVDDIDQFWKSSFEAQGWEYQSPDRVQGYTSRIRTACGRTPLYNALYCRPANRIYYDVRLLQRQFSTIGDYAPAIIIAHEWGHVIQSQRGLLRKDNGTYALEQQADCFAGAYTGDAAGRGVLEDSDIQESRDLFGQLGSDKTHGSGKQRAAAFNNGLKNGVAGCWEYTR